MSCPIRPRRIVTGLSAITWERTRKPFLLVGSMVTRKSGASTISDVIWQITTEACVSGSASVWTMTAGRGFPWSPAAATVTTSPRFIVRLDRWRQTLKPAQSTPAHHPRSVDQDRRPEPPPAFGRIAIAGWGHQDVIRAALVSAAVRASSSFVQLVRAPLVLLASKTTVTRYRTEGNGGRAQCKVVRCRCAAISGCGRASGRAWCWFAGWAAFGHPSPA